MEIWVSLFISNWTRYIPFSHVVWFLVAIACSVRLSAQTSSQAVGYPPVLNFQHDQYDAHYQNWSVVVDHNGFIYSANGNGILEYDGENWRLITQPGLKAVRIIWVDEHNTKWIGADRDLGYLEADSLGFLQFKSLKDHIPPEHPLTGSVWKVFPMEDQVLFFTDYAGYCWKNGRFTVVTTADIHREFFIHDKVYIRVRGEGMFILDDQNNLVLAPDGAAFKDIGIHIMLPYTDTSLLMGSKDKGLFIYDGVSLTKFDNEIDEFLDEHILYKAALLPDSSYAFATLRSGVVTMDRQGKRIDMITTPTGVLNNQVHGLAVDHENGLWLALQTGLSKVEPVLPYTSFDKRSALEGTVSTIVRHQGVLYVGTFSGLFRLRNLTDDKSRFERIDGIETGCFSLLSDERGLLASTANGVFLIEGQQVTQINELMGSRFLYQLNNYPNRVYVGHMGGLASIKYDDGSWLEEQDYEQIEEDIFSIVEDQDGALWLGTSLHSVLKITLDSTQSLHEVPNLDKASISHFDHRHGLPKGSTNVFYIDGEILVNSDGVEGPLFKFDPEKQWFNSTRNYGSKFDIDSLIIYPEYYQLDGNHILLTSLPIEGKSNRFTASRQSPSHDYQVERLFDERFRSTTENKVFWDDQSVLWLGGEAVVTRYDLNQVPDFNYPFEAFIRKVTVGQDSIIFGGVSVERFYASLSYKNNALRFEYASPTFMGNNTVDYQYYLTGFDENWSDWTFETKKDYTNLPEGSYQFNVRARNIFGNISSIDTYNFEITPPWYKSWWSYLVYLLLFIGLMTGIFRWRARKLRAEKAALEELVLVRTQEVQSQAKQLKKQAENLKSLDRVKSRFFANISHEFRTPLTLILGPLQDVLKGNSPEVNKQEIGIMHRNAKRLQNLINQLLDLSKIESGKLELRVTQGDICHFLSAILSSFGSLAKQRNIDFNISLPEHFDGAYFDEDKLEKIVNNLVSNAFKFTPEGSQITTKVTINHALMRLEVIDSGSGIPADQQQTIFDRFVQLDGSETREQEGTGIGLALTKELVTLCHGTIELESTLGKGSRFIVSLPINKQAFESNEIMLEGSTKTISSVSPTASEEELIAFTPDGLGEIPVVLIVEDQSELRYYMKKHLKTYQVLEASNGIEGLDQALNAIPDLIISDVMMPKMDGMSLLQTLKTDERTSHIPVILLTAKADLPSKMEGLEIGADDYLTKPFDAEELLARCHNLIEQRKLLRERFSRTMILKPQDLSITSADEVFLKKVMEVLEMHMGNSQFSVEIFQREMGMSRMQLHRKLKALTNHSTSEFVRVQRLKRASQLLTDSDATISDICYLVGFNSLSYFTKCFKEQYGVTPTDYALAQSH